MVSNRTDKRHRTTCLDYMRREHEHLQHLSQTIERGKSIKLWMYRNHPDFGVHFCSDKPEMLHFKNNGDIMFDIGGEFIAGDPIYSMKVLFPSLALHDAGRSRVQITDVSEELGRPSYVIERID